MDPSIKQVISMLVSSEKITLFTITGEIIEIKNDDDYDTARISEFLTPKLSGLAAVEINLSDYSRMAQILPSDLEDHGILITQVINGREVQGIFYPKKVTVSVAVGTERVTIPDVENLTGHIRRAVDEKSPSVANFLKRLAPLIQSRRHSGEDLMKFIKQSEMPLTNDGRIIAYKRVKMSSEQGYYVDCHTGNVKQRVGSRVTMPVDMVDPSRHQSCSTGLHVANLGYMKGFNGDHTLIVLVNPEDFIAVPQEEDTKARVSAYEIIGVMSGMSHGTVSQGIHVSGDTNLQELIKKAVEGNHMRPVEEILVGNYGKMESVTPLALLVGPRTPVAVSSGKSLSEDKKPDEPSRDAVKATRLVLSQAAPVEIPDEVIEAFDLLLSGVSKAQVAHRMITSTRSIGRWMEKWNFAMYQSAAEALPDEAEEVDQETLEATTEMAPEIIENLAQKEAPVSDDDFAAMVQTSEAPKPPTKVEQMRKLYNNWILGGRREEDLNAIKLFKGFSKKSFSALGLTSEEEAKIKDTE